MKLPSMARNRVAATVVLAAAVAAGAAACTGGTSPATSTTSPTASASGAIAATGPLAGLSAQQIFTKALSDLKAAPVVRVKGSIRDSGQLLAINVTIVRTTGCQGSFTQGGAGSFSVTAINHVVWLKADDQFLRSQGVTAAGVLNLLHGRYIKLSAGSPGIESLAPLCDSSSLAAGLGDNDQGMIMGPRTTIGGRPVQELHQKGQSGTAYVSVAAKPEIVRITASGSNPGGLDFTTYSQPVRLMAPPADQTIDGAQVGM